MKIAAIYDIHGNYTALKAVLSEIEKCNVDKIIVGGDLAWGPQPFEVVSKLYENRDKYLFVMGNGDREMFEKRHLKNSPPDNVFNYCLNRLNSNHLEWFGQFNTNLIINGIFFVHGSPRSDTEAIRFNTPEEDVLEMLKGIDYEYIVCGHTHIQFHRNIGNYKVINAGSVGLQSRASGACWLYFDNHNFEMRVTEYDVLAASKDILNTCCPRKKEFAEHILNPPHEGP